jgi:hypothetical protein
MTEVIEYSDLNESESLTARFDRGSVSVRLSESRAEACTALIETCTSVYSIKKDVGIARRTWVLFHALWVTARVTLFHSRLMLITPLLVLRQPQWRVTRENNSKVFHFERRTV